MGGEESKLGVVWSALAKGDGVDGFDMMTAVKDVLAYASDAPWNAWLFTKPWIKQQKIELSSRHLYGSARLGIAKYWPGQYAALWDYENSIVDTARLLGHQPWFSYALNAHIEKDSVLPCTIHGDSTINRTHLRSYSELGSQKQKLAFFFLKITTRPGTPRLAQSTGIAR